VPEADPQFREALTRLIQLPDGLPEKLQPRELILDESFGRTNAKTSLASFLLHLHLCSPEARQNSQLYSAAQ
jgi:hypothetical protein